MKSIMSTILEFVKRNKYAIMLIIISETNRIEKLKKKGLKKK